MPILEIKSLINTYINALNLFIKKYVAFMIKHFCCCVDNKCNVSVIFMHFFVTFSNKSYADCWFIKNVIYLINFCCNLLINVLILILNTLDERMSI